MREGMPSATSAAWFAAAIAVAFTAGRVMGPGAAPVAAQEKPAGETGPREPRDLGTPRPLGRLHDVDATLNARSGEKLVSVARAKTWSVETLGRHTLVRLSDDKEKLWYFPLETVLWIEAMPSPGTGPEPKGRR
jgi:hypothetical protein